MNISQVEVSKLSQYGKNSRTHSDEQVTQIAKSITEFGFTNPVLTDGENGIIAGHGRVMAARKLGMDTVPCIELSGLSDTQKRAYIIADNKLALNASWDDGLLALELGELKDIGFNLGLIGFSQAELNDIFLIEDDKEDSKYTQNVNIPTYTPSGDKPSLEELYDDEKAMDLITTIQKSSLKEDEKQFLMAAASRHIVFNYKLIANFYAHSSKECQELMEGSALVIIDFNKAIENGFVKLTDDINEMFNNEEDE